MKRIFLVLLALLLTAGMVFAGGSQGGAAPAAGGSQGGAAPAAADNGLGDYPNRPIQCIVPYAPGGGTDVFVRTLLKYIKLPQPIAVVNIDGASGLVGAMQAYNSPNDGYTILAQMPMDLIGMDLSKQSDVPLWRELVPICWAVTDYNGTFTNKQSGFKSIEDVVAYAKANPGKLTWGTVGAKSVNYVLAIRVIRGLGLEGLVTVVPYDGGATIRTALMGNHVQVTNNSIGDYVSIIKSGDALPLMLITDKRTNLSPDTPTTVEKGLTDIVTLVPRGFYGPKGMNPAIARYLDAEFKKGIENPAYVAEMATQNADAYYLDGVQGHARTETAYEEMKPFFDQF